MSKRSKADKAESRHERLAKALKANLKRRKTQARAKTELSSHVQEKPKERLP